MKVKVTTTSIMLFLLIASLALAQETTYNPMPVPVAVPLDNEPGYISGSANPAIMSLPSNIREWRVGLTSEAVVCYACKFEQLVGRFGRHGVQLLCGRPASLPVKASGWFTWGKDDRIQVPWSVVTPEQSVAMPGWLIDLGDGWFIHLQLGEGCPQWGRNVIVFYGTCDENEKWCPPPLGPMPERPTVQVTQFEDLCLDLQDVTATCTLRQPCLKPPCGETAKPGVYRMGSAGGQEEHTILEGFGLWGGGTRCNTQPNCGRLHGGGGHVITPTHGQTYP